MANEGIRKKNPNDSNPRFASLPTRGSEELDRLSNSDEFAMNYDKFLHDNLQSEREHSLDRRRCDFAPRTGSDSPVILFNYGTLELPLRQY